MERCWMEEPGLKAILPQINDATRTPGAEGGRVITRPFRYQLEGVIPGAGGQSHNKLFCITD